jgi:hypothetical protein
MADEAFGETPSKIIASAERYRAQAIRQLMDLGSDSLSLRNVSRETLLDMISQYEIVMRHYGWKDGAPRNSVDHSV